MKLKQTQGLLLTFYISLIILCLTECQLGGPGKRVTTVTGRVIDEAQQPVDSVLIFVSSTGFARPSVNLGETYTDKEGNYQLVFDVSKDFDGVTVGISFNRSIAFSNKYKDYSYNKRESNTEGTCCPVRIGAKTSYDFTLLFR
ncbi:peptidase associated/transthyretin-like domain-containing protein [Arundinibacter roseus]|uniref:Carboxypeptidase regulatory-like domain-containing protein n=1 Tax=Arundinibacter roseus TaxID=2070510 RepID=A0A4R4KGH9_9BACT|nr:hypothetical protein [Arundinibacter roseus]TDB66783.1 hypothetical protein EZE20_06570 [Arundinibacter roseus]